MQLLWFLFVCSYLETLRKSWGTPLNYHMPEGRESHHWDCARFKLTCSLRKVMPYPLHHSHLGIMVTITPQTDNWWIIRTLFVLLVFVLLAFIFVLVNTATKDVFPKHQNHQKHCKQILHGCTEKKPPSLDLAFRNKFKNNRSFFSIRPVSIFLKCPTKMKSMFHFDLLTWGALETVMATVLT